MSTLLRITGVNALFDKARLEAFGEAKVGTVFVSEQFQTLDAAELTTRLKQAEDLATKEHTPRAYLEFGAAFADSRDYRYASRSRGRLMRKAQRQEWRRSYMTPWLVFVRNNLHTDLETLATEKLTTVAATPDATYLETK